jgi:hypothetical protein
LFLAVVPFEILGEDSALVPLILETDQIMKKLLSAAAVTLTVLSYSFVAQAQAAATTAATASAKASKKQAPKKERMHSRCNSRHNQMTGKC